MDVEKLEPLWTSVRNVNWCSHCRKKAALQNIHGQLLYDNISHFCIYIPRTKESVLNKYLISNIQTVWHTTEKKIWKQSNCLEVDGCVNIVQHAISTSMKFCHMLQIYQPWRCYCKWNKPKAKGKKLSCDFTYKKDCSLTRGDERRKMETGDVAGRKGNFSCQHFQYRKVQVLWSWIILMVHPTFIHTKYVNMLSVTKL